MNVLVLNVGSSTLKFQLIATDGEVMREDRDRRLAEGVVERIGGLAIVRVAVNGRREVHEASLRDHRATIEHILRWIASPESSIEAITSLADIDAVGHRVVHGGQEFRRSVLIDDEVIAGIEAHIDLAPLHNPSNLKGIRAVAEALGSGVPQVAVFDTAFHATMPPEAFLYAIPYHYYRRFRIRRYGFHGTSHRYVRYRYGKLTDTPRAEIDLITIHLGNGCSACAIKGGESIDTSMGFTPLEGLVMGTRSGDIDPAVVDFIGHAEGLSSDEVETLLNKQSGLLGISGMTSDMRELLAEEAESNDRRVTLAIDIFCRRVTKYIGAYFAELGGAAAVVFTGGIGENSPTVRERICRGLGCLGLHIDPERNGLVGEAGRITTDASTLAAWVIPTDEELLIARDTVRIVESASPAR